MCACVGDDRELCKNDRIEPIEIAFVVQTHVDSRSHSRVFQVKTLLREMTSGLAGSGDADCCQITLDTCYCYHNHVSQPRYCRLYIMEGRMGIGTCGYMRDCVYIFLVAPLACCCVCACVCRCVEIFFQPTPISKLV